jgi:hypothetical protein
MARILTFDEVVKSSLHHRTVICALRYDFLYDHLRVQADEGERSAAVLHTCRHANSDGT